MAATVAVLGTSVLNTTAGNKTITATPTVGDLIVVITVATGVTTSLADNGTGGTYTQVDSTRTGFSTSGNLQMWVRNNLVSSASSTVYTATQTSSTGGGLVILRVTGMSVAGAAAVRSSGGQSTGTSGTTPAPVLSQTPLSSNPVIAAIANASNSTTTLVPRTGYTEVFDNGYNTPATGLEVNYRASGETSATLTQGGTSGTAFASIAIELQYNSAPTVALDAPADAGTIATTTPQLTFTGTDVDSDTVSYEIELDASSTFANFFNIANATYNSKNLDVSGQVGATVLSVYVKPDGTKAYVQDNTNKTVYQYSLATPFDISSGTYDSKSFSFNTQDTNPRSVFFKPDGTKLYANGITNDAVYQYSLSTPWDVSTASYDSKSFSTLAQDTSTNGLFISQDGKNAYVGGVVNSTVYQYSLSTPWDASTGTYAGKSFSYSTQATNAESLTFSYDGKKLFVQNNVGGASTIYQYTLATPWDISTASYDSVSKTITSQDNSAQGIHFNPSGNALYVVGDANNKVFQYDLTGLGKFSSLDTGFTDITDGSDTDPFDSGDQVGYTVQAGDALTNGNTYYWRVRGIDPSGSNAYGAWATTRSFTVSSGTSASVTQVAANVTAAGGTQTVAAVSSSSITQVAGTVTATGGTQTIVGKVNASVIQVTANVTAAGGTQAVASVQNASITQVAGTVTAAGGTQVVDAIVVVSASITQVAASVTASGGTQVVASSQIASVTQSAANVTASGGTQTIATMNNVSVTQLAGTVTATGSTQVIATVNNASVTQSAGTVTASGGTQTVSSSSVVNASITQVAANITAAGGTQVVATSNIVSISQSAASVTASGGTQTVAASQNGSVAQLAASVTASGGTQSVDTVNNVALTQTAGTVTANGGTQTLAAAINAAIAQQAANVTAQGGTQDVFADSGATSVDITQLAASLTASGGTQVISTSTGPLPSSRKYYIDSNGDIYWIISQAIGLVEKV